jgi:hypothetical protein
MLSHVWTSAGYEQWKAMLISIENLLEDEQGLSMGEMLTVDFGTPSYEFTVNICTYLIFWPMVLTPRRYQVHSRMSILEFVVYAGN